jgi:probable F420-dependent oxidoreductase
MRYGLQLPVQSQSTIYVQPWERGAGAAELVQVAQACEAAGFDYVAVCDHVAIPRAKADAMSLWWQDTFTTLGYLAAGTERVALLSHVYVLAYRHPMVAAKGFATLDHLSGGRAIVGIGVGHVEEEFDLLGVSFADRGAITDENIDAVRAALDDEHPSHAGKQWQFSEVGARPRPVQARLPIWVGGSSPAAMRRAAERGDGWLPQGPPEGGMEAGIARVREQRAAAGKADEPFTIGALSGPLRLDAPEKVIGYLRTFRDMGVDQVQVSFRSGSAAELCEQIARFGAEVAPRVDEGG